MKCPAGKNVCMWVIFSALTAFYEMLLLDICGLQAQYLKLKNLNVLAKEEQWTCDVFNARRLNCIKMCGFNKSKSTDKNTREKDLIFAERKKENGTDKYKKTQQELERQMNRKNRRGKEKAGGKKTQRCI